MNKKVTMVKGKGKCNLKVPAPKGRGRGRGRQSPLPPPSPPVLLSDVADDEELTQQEDTQVQDMLMFWLIVFTFSFRLNVYIVYSTMDK